MDMKSKILHLYDRFEKGGLSFKNRFLRSATHLASCCDATGAVSEAEVGRHAEIAAGGAGTVVTGFAFVNLSGKSSRCQWGLHNEDRISDVERLASAVHRFDARLIVQIVHAGSQRNDAVLGTAPTYSPSGLAHPVFNTPSLMMTKDDIAAVCRDFAASARRAKAGGADGVEIHAGHGFLFTQFLSPVINKREDEYGGCFENRMRILREVFSSVRESVGSDFPVWFKISISEGTENGYKAEEGIKAAICLLEDGADAAEVSNGTPYAGAQNLPSVIGISGKETEAPFASFAALLKKQATKDKTIILTGGIRSLPKMAELIDSDVCDLLGMSRPFNAEPDLVNRWAEEDSRPSACLSCNACLNTIKTGVLTCPVMRDRNEGYWDPL